MKTSFLLLLILCAFLNIQVNAQEKTFTIGGNDWMIPQLSSFKFSQNDTVMAGGIAFFKRDILSKYIPDGWSLPTAADIRALITALDGEANRTGGKTVDSAYLKSKLPLSLSGIYFVARQRLAGAGYMTAFYTSTDTLRSYDSTGTLKKAQVALHIYSNGRAKINIEPTFARLPESAMYCQLILIRRKKQ